MNRWLLCCAYLCLCLALPARAALPPIIPLAHLVGDHAYALPLLAPDGRYVSYIAPDDEEQLQLWIRDVQQGETSMLTQIEHPRQILAYYWAFDNNHLLYLTHEDGDEELQLNLVDLQGSDTTLMTRSDGRFFTLHLSPDRPTMLLVNMVDDDGYSAATQIAFDDEGSVTWHPGDDIPAGAFQWFVDGQLTVRLVVKPIEDGSRGIFTRNNEDDDWKCVAVLRDQDIFAPVSLSLDGRRFYYLTNDGEDTTRLIEMQTQSGAHTALSTNAAFDIDHVLQTPRDGVLGYSVYGTHREWTAVQDRIEPIMAHLQQTLPGELNVLNTTVDGQRWLVGSSADDRPTSFYLYNTQTGECLHLFDSRPALQGFLLAQKRPIAITSRDDMTLHGYLSLPPGVPETMLPMVLLVHGGPEMRDHWTFEPTVQWLTNRGYAVLQINYRGSSGYGKHFWAAGDGEWGGKMQDDLTDAVRWAIQQQVADPQRVAIMGMSYGGYAALYGLASTPELYACGVSYMGPTDLPSLYEMAGARNGVISGLRGDTPEERALLRERSPLFIVDQITAPVFMAHGMNDPRVPVEDFLEFVDALLIKGHPVEGMLYEDEGHTLNYLENRMDFFTQVEQFLAQHIGGRTGE